jgi:hypothetical protein
LPLAVLELYLRAQERPGALLRVATATLVFVLTLAMGTGIFAVTMTSWVPTIKTAYDSRKSIADILSATIATSGIDQAVRQYHDLKSGAPTTYNFDEQQLNGLGYELLRANKFKDANRIFQLNIESYPQSSNVYDSLGEGYADEGDKVLAIANYQKSAVKPNESQRCPDAPEAQRALMQNLLVAQGTHRVDQRGPAGRQVAG